MSKVQARRAGAKKREVRPSFVALERTSVRGVGSVVAVELDRDTEDFAHLVGKKIVIDGRLETCFSVERVAGTGPWRTGERISVCIRKAR